MHDEGLNGEFLVLGCGYTGQLVASRLSAKGLRVRTTRRDRLDFTQPGATGELRRWLTPGCRVLHSIPALTDRADEMLLQALQPEAARVVYLSTTSVYGATAVVDENTPVAPRTEREQRRADTEAAVAAGPWSALIVRPAAIYGPGRGVHVRLQEGRYRIPEDGSNTVSRIHVDDLAAIAEAALLGDLTGAFPVADDEPCTAFEIAEFCSRLLHMPLPESSFEPGGDPPVNRRVNGRAIRRLLGIELRYPSYRVGIPASL